MEIQERPESIGSLTPAAAAKARDLLAGEEDVSVLRVAIEGGGCSGFQYGLGFDRGPQEGDHEFECEGVTVVVDPFSSPYLFGARVDYLETIQESGFKIDNPNAVASCGCGHSFQVADDADPGEGDYACGSGCSHYLRPPDRGKAPIRPQVGPLPSTSMSENGSDRPFRVAVVGSGPAGFYAA